MARPKKTVSPVAAIDEAFVISSEPFDGQEPWEGTEEVKSERALQIEALSKLFPRAPLSEYDDALINALYTQHVGTTVRPE